MRLISAFSIKRCQCSRSFVKQWVTEQSHSALTGRYRDGIVGTNETPTSNRRYNGLGSTE